MGPIIARECAIPVLVATALGLEPGRVPVEKLVSPQSNPSVLRHTSTLTLFQSMTQINPISPEYDLPCTEEVPTCKDTCSKVRQLDQT